MTRAGEKLYADDAPLRDTGRAPRLAWRRYVLLAIVVGLMIGHLAKRVGTK